MLDGPHAFYIWLLAVVLLPAVVVVFASTRIRAAAWTAILFLIGISTIAGPMLYNAMSMPAGSSKNQLLLKVISTMIATAVAGGLIAYRFFSAKAWYLRSRSPSKNNQG